MSADRFETELRDLLRTEAASVPIQMSIADLRARAGTRSRWSWATWPQGARFALAGGGVAAVALALAFGLGRAQQPPDVGASPDPSTSPSASAGATANLFDRLQAGSLVVVRVTDDVLSVVAVNPAGEESVLGTIDGLASLAPDHRLEDDSVQAVGPNGDVLITVFPGNVDETGSMNVLVRLGQTMSVDRIVPSGKGTFGPAGTLVLATEGGRSFTVVDDQGGGPVAFELPGAVALPDRKPLLTADGSGLIASRPSADGQTFDSVVIGLDGTARSFDPAATPWLTSGAERNVGAANQRLSQPCDTGPAAGGCFLRVHDATQEPSAGTDIGPDDQCCASFAWSPGGDAVVMLATGGGVWRWDGTSTTQVATLAADVARATPRIAGFQAGLEPPTVLLESYLGTTVQPLDGSPVTTIPGQLLLVIP